MLKQDMERGAYSVHGVRVLWGLWNWKLDLPVRQQKSAVHRVNILRWPARCASVSFGCSSALSVSSAFIAGLPPFSPSLFCVLSIRTLFAPLAVIYGNLWGKYILFWFLLYTHYTFMCLCRQTGLGYTEKTATTLGFIKDSRDFKRN